MDKEFLTVSEVADRLRLSEVTISRMIAGGELAAFRFRGSLRVRPGDLDAYIAAQAIKSAPSTEVCLT